VSDPYAAGLFACSQCGHRQSAEDVCGRCRSDTIHDLRKSNTRELFDDIDMRLRDKIEGRVRAGAVVLSITIIILLWMVPAYREARGKAYPGLPLFADQVILMTLLALAILKVGESKLQRKRFPYLESLPPPEK
jgi:hypothetical protein